MFTLVPLLPFTAIAWLSWHVVMVAAGLATWVHSSTLVVPGFRSPREADWPYRRLVDAKAQEVALFGPVYTSIGYVSAWLICSRPCTMLTWAVVAAWLAAAGTTTVPRASATAAST